MRDEEKKVLTTGDMFYNTLSARQTLRRHRRWSYRRSSMPALVPSTSCRDVVSGTDLLPLPASNLHCIDVHRCRADSSTTMSNALHGMSPRLASIVSAYFSLFFLTEYYSIIQKIQKTLFRWPSERAVTICEVDQIDILYEVWKNYISQIA